MDEDLRKLNDIMDFTGDFLAKQGIEDWVGSSSKSIFGEYRATFYLPMDFDERWKLNLMLIDAFIDNGFDTSYPVVHLEVNRHWLEERDD